MPHVGNDIIDWTDPEKAGKSRNIRFISRVFTEAEKKRIFSSPDPDRMLWTLWAGKETAYKVMRKSHPEIVSIPRSYEVRLDGPEGLQDGTVKTPAGPVSIRFSEGTGTLHVFGMDDSGGLEGLICGVERMDTRACAGVSPADLPSLRAREALIYRVAGYLECDPGDMEIRRAKDSRGSGPPRLYINGQASGLDISLSHDGRFVAYVFTT